MKKWILAILIGIFIMRSVGLKSSDFKTINGASIVGSGDIALTTIGGIGGSTGATDNRVLRADGTGGATLQSSGVTIDDTGNITAASGKFTGSTITYGTNSHTIVDNGSNGFYMTVGATVCFQIGASGNASFVGGTGIGFGPSSMAANNYLDVSTAATFKFKNAANSAGADVECASLTLSGGHNLAPITKASLLASTPNAATGGRWRVTDSSPANQEAYPDGSAWRWAHDNSAVV